MPAITEGKNLEDVLFWENTRNYARQNGTLAEGQNLKLGTVLGQVAADKKFKILDTAASNGTEKAKGILLADCDASDGDTKMVYSARSSIVKLDGLVFPEGITEEQKTIAITELNELGILAK